MNLTRTPLLIETGVPVDWPKTVGYPPPGVVRASGYPAGKGDDKDGEGIDAEYDCSPEGKKIAKAHAWMFPSKRVKACGKKYRY